MRFGNWRGVTLAIVLTSAFAAEGSGPARADLFHTIPREVVAVDVNTGGEYMAPPVPYGHYAKDGCVGTALGLACSPFGMLKGKLCGLLHGGGCGGGGCGDPGCGACGGSGCGFCQGRGLLRNLGCGGGGKGCSDPCGGSGGNGNGNGNVCGGLGRRTGGGCGIASTSGGLCPLPTAQSVIPSTQSMCAEPGCSLRVRHFHRKGRGCSQCGGMGCAICQGGAGFSSGSLCGGCRGAGCGACGGRGLCGGGLGGSGCGACGGAGCKLCLGGGILKASHSILGLPHALVAKAFHVGEVKYFVGPGGPVPLTPGYVPYVVTTRSPRDFLAFPPFVDATP